MDITIIIPITITAYKLEIDSNNTIAVNSNKIIRSYNYRSI